jgi:hypothetical protein
MNLNEINAFLSGAIGLGFVVLAYFFLGYWQRSRIGLYGFFALAFAILAIERTVLLFGDPFGELRPFVYAFRLGAFLVIIIGIANQNQRRP